MNYNNNKIAPIIIVLAICAVVLVFLFMRAQDYKDQANIIASENVLLERDIELIESEGDESGRIDSDISELKDNIQSIVGGRNVTSKNMKDSLSNLCVDAGIESYEIVVGAPNTLQAQGDFAQALIRCDATITFYGEEGAGYGLIQGIEMNTESKYEIVSFGYVNDGDTNLIAVGDWTIVVAVYYFEETADA